MSSPTAIGRNLAAGEPLDEYLPVTSSGLKAKLIRGDGNAETVVETADVLSRDESAVASFTKTELSGIYRVSTASQPDSLFAVNVPVTAPGGGAESDLRRWSPVDLQAAAPEASLQVVREAGDVQSLDAIRLRPGQSSNRGRTPGTTGFERRLVLFGIGLWLDARGSVFGLVSRLGAGINRERLQSLPTAPAHRGDLGLAVADDRRPLPAGNLGARHDHGRFPGISTRLVAAFELERSLDVPAGGSGRRHAAGG